MWYLLPSSARNAPTLFQSQGGPAGPDAEGEGKASRHRQEATARPVQGALAGPQCDGRLLFHERWYVFAQQAREAWSQTQGAPGYRAACECRALEKLKVAKNEYVVIWAEIHKATKLALKYKGLLTRTHRMANEDWTSCLVWDRALHLD